MVYIIYWHKNGEGDFTFQDHRIIDNLCRKYHVTKIPIGINYHTFEEVVDSLNGTTIVRLDAEGKTDLDKFKHPEKNVAYYFGSDYNGMSKKDKRWLPGETVRIPEVSDQHHPELYASTVIPMVLYARSLYFKESLKEG